MLLRLAFVRTYYAWKEEIKKQPLLDSGLLTFKNILNENIKISIAKSFTLNVFTLFCVELSMTTIAMDIVKLWLDTVLYDYFLPIQSLIILV